MRIFVATAALAFAAGCAAPPTQDLTAADATDSTTAVPEVAVGYAVDSGGGTYHVVFLPLPNDLPLNELFSMDVWLYDSAGHWLVYGTSEHGFTLEPSEAGENLVGEQESFSYRRDFLLDDDFLKKAFPSDRPPLELLD